MATKRNRKTKRRTRRTKRRTRVKRGGGINESDQSLLNESMFDDEFVEGEDKEYLRIHSLIKTNPGRFVYYKEENEDFDKFLKKHFYPGKIIKIKEILEPLAKDI